MLLLAYDLDAFNCFAIELDIFVHHFLNLIKDSVNILFHQWNLLINSCP